MHRKGLGKEIRACSGLRYARARMMQKAKYGSWRTNAY